MQIDENKLNMVRARAGLTLKEAGIYPRLMKRIKDGDPLHMKTIHRIATALNCDPADIVKGGDS